MKQQNESFGSMLRRERKKRGWNLQEFAQRAQVSVPYLSQIETRSDTPSAELAERFANVFDFHDVAREHFLFVARGIPAKLDAIRKMYPTSAKEYCRRVG